MMHKDSPNFAAAAEAVHLAFAGTPVPELTLGQHADQYFGEKPNAIVHQAKHWSEVTDAMFERGHHNCCDTILIFAPDETWRHYAPALMLRSIEAESIERTVSTATAVLQAITPVPGIDESNLESYRARVSGFSPEQMHAMRMFVTATLELDIWQSERLMIFADRLRRQWALH